MFRMHCDRSNYHQPGTGEKRKIDLLNIKVSLQVEDVILLCEQQAKALNLSLSLFYAYSCRDIRTDDMHRQFIKLIDWHRS